MNERERKICIDFRSKQIADADCRRTKNAFESLWSRNYKKRKTWYELGSKRYDQEAKSSAVTLPAPERGSNRPRLLGTYTFQLLIFIANSQFLHSNEVLPELRMRYTSNDSTELKKKMEKIGRLSRVIFVEDKPSYPTPKISKQEQWWRRTKCHVGDKKKRTSGRIVEIVGRLVYRINNELLHSIDRMSCHRAFDDVLCHCRCLVFNANLSKQSQTREKQFNRFQRGGVQQPIDVRTQWMARENKRPVNKAIYSKYLHLNNI